MITREELEMLTDLYIMLHRTDDFPMDMTLEDLEKKVIEWSEQNEDV